MIYIHSHNIFKMNMHYLTMYQAMYVLSRCTQKPKVHALLCISTSNQTSPIYINTTILQNQNITEIITEKYSCDISTIHIDDYL